MQRGKNITVKSAIVQERDAELTLLIFQHINHLISQVATVASLYLDGESNTCFFIYPLLHMVSSWIFEGYKSLFVAAFISHH